MPVTKGIQCAYCAESFQSDYQLEIHRKNNHRGVAEKNIEKNNDERDRIRRNKTVY